MAFLFLTHAHARGQRRLDDEATLCGELSGVYNPDFKTADSVLIGFLEFCCMAAVHARVLPAGWNWPALLDVAIGRLPRMLDPDTAREENGPLGVQALRALAEAVLGRLQGDDPRSEPLAEIREQLAMLEVHFIVDVPMVLFDGIGGHEAWVAAVEKLKAVAPSLAVDYAKLEAFEHGDSGEDGEGDEDDEDSQADEDAGHPSGAQ
jgi:hypothetical protein